MRANSRLPLLVGVVLLASCMAEGTPTTPDVTPNEAASAATDPVAPLTRQKYDVMSKMRPSYGYTGYTPAARLGYDWQNEDDETAYQRAVGEVSDRLRPLRQHLLSARDQAVTETQRAVAAQSALREQEQHTVDAERTEEERARAADQQAREQQVQAETQEERARAADQQAREQQVQAETQAERANAADHEAREQEARAHEEAEVVDHHAQTTEHTLAMEREQVQHEAEVDHDHLYNEKRATVDAQERTAEAQTALERAAEVQDAKEQRDEAELAGRERREKQIQSNQAMEQSRLRRTAHSVAQQKGQVASSAHHVAAEARAVKAERAELAREKGIVDAERSATARINSALAGGVVLPNPNPSGEADPSYYRALEHIQGTVAARVAAQRRQDSAHDEWHRGVEANSKADLRDAEGVTGSDYVPPVDAMPTPRFGRLPMLPPPVSHKGVRVRSAAVRNALRIASDALRNSENPLRGLEQSKKAETAAARAIHDPENKAAVQEHEGLKKAETAAARAIHDTENKAAVQEHEGHVAAKSTDKADAVKRSQKATKLHVKAETAAARAIHNTENKAAVQEHEGHVAAKSTDKADAVKRSQKATKLHVKAETAAARAIHDTEDKASAQIADGKAHSQVAKTTKSVLDGMLVDQDAISPHVVRQEAHEEADDLMREVQDDDREAEGDEDEDDIVPEAFFW